jgi:hypothetical protein
MTLSASQNDFSTPTTPIEFPSNAPGQRGGEVDARNHSVGRKKTKGRIRSAWIAFIGRVVAQVVGALATVALGFLLRRQLA